MRVSWIPLIAWVAALVVGVVILGFCGYEVAWKADRLRRDLARLQALTEPIAAIQNDIAAARHRALRAAQSMRAGTQH